MRRKSFRIVYDKVFIFVLLLACVIGYFYYKTYIEGFDENIDYLDGIDVIYWINLDRSKDRRERMEEMFKDPVFKGKNIVRIKAVDGKDPNIDEILKKNFDDMNPKLTKLEYACTLSHINAMREFAKTDYKIALILEDDTTLDFKPYWKKTTKQIMDEAPSDWDILQLNYTLSHEFVSKPKMLKDLKLYAKNNETFWGTGSYIINKNNINKLLTNRSVYDGADGYIFKTLITYIYKYPLFTYKYHEQSLIHQEHVKHHNKSKKIIEEMLKHETE